MLEKGQEFCEKTWEVARKSVPPQPFIEQYCFRAPYIVSLLREGLHITDNQVVIGSGSITWTLGVALFEAGNALSPRQRLPSYQIFQMKIHPIFLTAALVISLILLVCAISCLGNGMPRIFRRPYLPIFLGIIMHLLQQYLVSLHHSGSSDGVLLVLVSSVVSLIQF